MDVFVHVLGSATESARVPACPAWDVRDLCAHQVHQLKSACDGTFPVKDSLDAIAAPEPLARADALSRQDRWIAEGLQARRATPLSAQIDEWQQLVAHAPSRALFGLFPDVVVHLFDLLGAVGSTSQRDHVVVVPALRFWARQSAARLEQAATGSMQLHLDMGAGRRKIIGNVDANTVVGGIPFELLRAITGRRSLRQAQRLRWEGADDRAIACFPAYGWRSEDLDE